MCKNRYQMPTLPPPILCPALRLGELTSKRVWAEQLPAGAPPARLVVPCSPPLEVEVEADPMAGGRLAALQRGTLAGLAFAPGSQWRVRGWGVLWARVGCEGEHSSRPCWG